MKCGCTIFFFFFFFFFSILQIAVRMSRSISENSLDGIMRGDCKKIVLIDMTNSSTTETTVLMLWKYRRIAICKRSKFYITVTKLRKQSTSCLNISNQFSNLKSDLIYTLLNILLSVKRSTFCLTFSYL